MSNEIESVISIFEDVKMTIRDGWCEGSYAQDAQGNTIDLESDNACSFCLAGALIRATSRYKRNHSWQEFSALHTKCWNTLFAQPAIQAFDTDTNDGVTYFNDACVSSDEVILVLDVTIANLKAMDANHEQA